MKIAIVAPGRSITPENAARTAAFAALVQPQLDLSFHPQCFLNDGHFAGSDAQRAAAFLDVANDAAFDVVWFARGGYGSNRILSAVMPNLSPSAKSKTYLGFSDMGFLLAALYARRIGRAVHGPMAIDVGRWTQDGGGRTLQWLATGDADALEPSLGRTPAVAFNLTILTALVGTRWLPDLTDHVLMIEEVSEPLYRIDRMLFQLGNATQLKGIAGVRLGRISDVQANDPPWAEVPEVMVRRWCGDLGVPYLGRADIGHDRDNRIVPFGVG